MGSRRKEAPAGSSFTRAVAAATLARFVKRRKALEAKAASVRETTWPYSVIRNKSKMAVRLCKVIETPAHPSVWETLAADQHVKLTRLLDPYTRWVRREMYLLEEMNRSDYRQVMSVQMGSAWYYSVHMQRSKMRQTILPGPRDDSRRWPGWNGVKNRANSRFLRRMKDPVAWSGPWDYAIAGTLQKMSHAMSLNTNWRKTISRACHRWGR